MTYPRPPKPTARQTNEALANMRRRMAEMSQAAARPPITRPKPSACAARKPRRPGPSGRRTAVVSYDLQSTSNLPGFVTKSYPALPGA